MELHRRMSRQAERYGSRLVVERAEALTQICGGFAVRSASLTLHARTVILATGVAVTEPQVDNLAEAVACGAVRYCPICDGLETGGKRIAVLGSKGASLGEAIFLRTYSDDITLLRATQACVLSQDQREDAARNGIRLEERLPEAIELVGDQLLVRFANSESDWFNIVYPCLGSAPRSDFAAALGADTTATGGLLVDSRQQTNIPGLYAAGDVLEGLDQIATACGQGATAATAIHNRLRQL
ncbi:MAG: NAD(P)/FAD-dependent oxidoreductase [Burkholderiales bacterium]|nr:MAG: NAD(P)/FAD-dependent oxidoreductase [Burkholderiales bacterium]